tara:strand:+ start:4549 stop:5076 length:528 start_codon:yes stop_codon:yes gene_type:complete
MTEPHYTVALTPLLSPEEPRRGASDTERFLEFSKQTGATLNLTHELTALEEGNVTLVRRHKGKHLGTNDQVCRFVKKYEQNPDRFMGSNQKIRYEANRRGFTLGELEVLLKLPGGTISNASQNRNDRTDAILSLFFGIPQEELRTIPNHTIKSRTAKIKKIAALLRDLANELETI